MKLEDFVRMCKNREWDSLLDMFPSDIADMGIKIAATAIIGMYHPEENIRNKYGLPLWQNLLSAQPTTRMQTMMTGAVTLIDFTNAYFIVTSYIDDIPAADSIKRYVKENILMLGQLLSHPLMPEQAKEQIKLVFGEDIVLSKAQKQAFFTREFARERSEKIAMLKAIEQVNQLLASVLQLKQTEFEFSYRQPSSMRGIVTDSAKGEIRFTHDISEERVSEYGNKLTSLGIQLYAYKDRIKLTSPLIFINDTLSTYCSQGNDNAKKKNI